MVNKRAAGTQEENKAVMQGSMAAYDTYSVDEAKKTFTSHIETSTFQNGNGDDQERSFTLAGDELKITNSHAATGAGTHYQVLKRALPGYRHGPLMAFLQPLCLFSKWL